MSIPVSSSIGLINPKSATNVGAVLRAASCFAAQTIFYTGERYRRAARFQTDTKNSVTKIPLTGVNDILQGHRAGQQIICVELVEGAQPLTSFQHPHNAYYIFGPEDGSIPQAVVDQADTVVYIPTVGCLNLAATVNVVLYDRAAKLNNIPPGNDLILKSRDVNNRVKVKPKHR